MRCGGRMVGWARDDQLPGMNETVRSALREAVERRRRDPMFKERIRRIIEEDRELLGRLAE